MKMILMFQNIFSQSKLAGSKIDMPEAVKDALCQLRKLQDYLCGKLYKGGFLDRPRKVSTTMILEAGKKVQRPFAQTKPSTPPQIFTLMTTQAMAMKTAHAILTLKTQGIAQFLDYSSRIMEEAKEAKLTGQISGYQQFRLESGT